MASDLILIPGLLCNGALWAAVIERLGEMVRCRVSEMADQDSIEAMADDVLRQAPDRFALAGFSMGGCVALEIVGRAPRRVGRLALLDTNAGGILALVRRHYEQSIAQIESGGLDEYLLDAFPRYVAATHDRDEKLRDAFVAMGKRVGAAAGMRQMSALLDYGGFCGNRGDIACPTVLTCGAADARTPVAAHEEMARKIPRARLEVIQDAGHFTPMEQPAAVAEVLAGWLRSDDGH